MKGTTKKNPLKKLLHYGQSIKTHQRNKCCFCIVCIMRGCVVCCLLPKKCFLAVDILPCKDCKVCTCPQIYLKRALLQHTVFVVCLLLIWCRLGGRVKKTKKKRKKKEKKVLTLPSACFLYYCKTHCKRIVFLF